MEVKYEIKWNEKVKKGLDNIPDDILFSVAKQTLDFSIPMIPMSDKVNHAGTLRLSSQRGDGSSEGGVGKCSGGYYIGSFTDYASYVWNMDAETTHWTTDGTTSLWFAAALKRYKTTIINNAINQSWKDNM